MFVKVSNKCFKSLKVIFWMQRQTINGQSWLSRKKIYFLRSLLIVQVTSDLHDEVEMFRWTVTSRGDAAPFSCSGFITSFHWFWMDGRLKSLDETSQFFSVVLVHFFFYYRIKVCITAKTFVKTIRANCKHVG